MTLLIFGALGASLCVITLRFWCMPITVFLLTMAMNYWFTGWLRIAGLSIGIAGLAFFILLGMMASWYCYQHPDRLDAE